MSENNRKRKLKLEDETKNSFDENSLSDNYFVQFEDIFVDKEEIFQQELFKQKKEKSSSFCSFKILLENLEQQRNNSKNFICQHIYKIATSEEIDKSHYFDKVKEYSSDKYKNNLQAINYLITMTKLNYGTLNNKELEQYYTHLKELVKKNQEIVDIINKKIKEKKRFITLKSFIQVDYLDQDIKLALSTMKQIISLPQTRWKPIYHKNWINPPKNFSYYKQNELETLFKMDKIRISFENKKLLDQSILVLLLISKHRKEISHPCISNIMIKGIVMLIIQHFCYHYKHNRIVK